MTLALVIAGSMLFGYAAAEVWYRHSERSRKRDRLIAEFMDKQLWQFLSLDDWLEKERCR